MVWFKTIGIELLLFAFVHRVGLLNLLSIDNTWVGNLETPTSSAGRRYVHFTSVPHELAWSDEL